MSIDLVLAGPSVSNYKFNADLTGETGSLPDGEIYDRLREIIEEKYPWASDFLKEKNISGSGRLDTWAFGFRYLLQIGFRF